MSERKSTWTLTQALFVGIALADAYRSRSTCRGLEEAGGSSQNNKSRESENRLSFEVCYG
jgi:hypothetical protein